MSIGALQAQYPRASGGRGGGAGGGAYDAVALVAIETPITPGDLEIRASVTVTASIRGK